MYAVRLGSYSIAATLAGMPSRRRLKSTLRYRRFAPPPRWRDVLRPLALRPPDFLSPSTRVFSGVFFVISAKSEYVTKRRPGLVGLGLRIGICLDVRLSARVRAGSCRDEPAKDAGRSLCRWHRRARGRRSGEVHARDPRVRGSEGGHQPSPSGPGRLVKIGMESPPRPCTIAFFHDRVLPDV